MTPDPERKIMTTNAEIPRFSCNDRESEMFKAIEETGVVIVEDLIDQDAVDAILTEAEAHLRRVDPEMIHINEVLQGFYAGARNVTGLASKSPTFVNALLLSPLLLGAAEAIVGPACASLSLNVGQLIVREPGAEQQWLHRDDDVWSFVPDPHPQLELSSVTALCEFSRENGATVAAPGSHRWEPGRQPEPDELAYAEMPAGAAIVYLGSTIHGGGLNSTQQARAGVHMSFVAGWLRTEENNCLSTPPAIARSLPRRAQELLGYGMHDAAALGGGYLGAVDLRDPVDLLAAGEL
ncbi:MAG: ectoine hydroxylase-related dioxygenase (phytanoyl-CoA dioxygenase family) [Verrucomicrobiales bacterium]